MAGIRLCSTDREATVSGIKIRHGDHQQWTVGVTYADSSPASGALASRR